MSNGTLPAKTGGVGEDLCLQTGGVFENVDRLAQAIKVLGEKFNLVMPGGAVGTKLPPCYAVGVSFVFVDVKHETYQIAGRPELGMGKASLERIAAAAGIRWNPSLCGRVDDGSSSNFVEYQVAGSVLQLDGTERMLSATKRIDLRAEEKSDPSTWGADAREIAWQAENASPRREPWPQILQMRQHILSLAETKAKNRAIRSLGIRASYSEAELAKGFAIAKLQFTGDSDDPETKHELSIMIGRRALESGSMLYGQVPQLPQRAVPRIITAKACAKDDEPEEEEAPDPAGSSSAAAAPAENPQAQAPVPPKENPELICGNRDGEGNWPRKPCSEFTVTDLKAKIASYEKKRPEWKPKWAAKNEAELAAMKAWLAFRELDPRQGTLDMNKPAAADKVPY